MGRRFVEGLKARSTSMQPATAGVSRPFSRQTPAASTVSAMSTPSGPTEPVTLADSVRHSASHKTR